MPNSRAGHPQVLALVPAAGAPAERRGWGATPSRARLLLEKAVFLGGGGRRPLPLRLGLTPAWR